MSYIVISLSTPMMIVLLLWMLPMSGSNMF